MTRHASGSCRNVAADKATIEASEITKPIDGTTDQVQMKVVAARACTITLFIRNAGTVNTALLGIILLSESLRQMAAYVMRVRFGEHL